MALSSYALLENWLYNSALFLNKAGSTQHVRETVSLVENRKRSKKCNVSESTDTVLQLMFKHGNKVNRSDLSELWFVLDSRLNNLNILWLYRVFQSLKSLEQVKAKNISKVLLY